MAERMMTNRITQTDHRYWRLDLLPRMDHREKANTQNHRQRSRSLRRELYRQGMLSEDERRQKLSKTYILE